MTTQVCAGPPLAAVRALLQAAQLPLDDLCPATEARLFFGVRQHDKWCAVVGLERLGDVALLRSLTVESTARGRGLGRALVEQAERAARTSGAAALYLLTTDATAYFAGLGFKPIERSRVPESVRGHTQFRQLCPASAAVLMKRLD